jgi:hypothetical protein
MTNRPHELAEVSANRRPPDEASDVASKLKILVRRLSADT